MHKLWYDQGRCQLCIIALISTPPPLQSVLYKVSSWLRPVVGGGNVLTVKQGGERVDIVSTTFNMSSLTQKVVEERSSWRIVRKGAKFMGMSQNVQAVADDGLLEYAAGCRSCMTNCARSAKSAKSGDDFSLSRSEVEDRNGERKVLLDEAEQPHGMPAGKVGDLPRNRNICSPEPSRVERGLTKKQDRRGEGLNSWGLFCPYSSDSSQPGEFQFST